MPCCLFTSLDIKLSSLTGLRRLFTSEDANHNKHMVIVIESIYQCFFDLNEIKHIKRRATEGRKQKGGRSEDIAFWAAMKEFFWLKCGPLKGNKDNYWP